MQGDPKAGRSTVPGHGGPAQGQCETPTASHGAVTGPLAQSQGLWHSAMPLT